MFLIISNILHTYDNQFSCSPGSPSYYEGFNVHVRLVKTSMELEIELSKLRPSDIIMTEPYLDFMRVVEVYEAQR